jgi:hypothetical protein
MYNSREKAVLDYEANLIDAQREAREAREAIENAQAEAREAQAEAREAQAEAREAIENANVEAREALKKGEAIGVEIGSIQLLQRLIGLSVQGQEELRVMPLEDLVTLRENLNTELQNRAS